MAETSNRPKGEPSPRNLSIYHQFVNGTPRARLAEKYGISPPRVSQLIRAVRSYIAESYTDDVTVIKKEQSRDIAFLYRQATRGWFRSLAPEVTVEVTTAPSGEVTRKEKHKTMTGNPAYINTAAKMLEQLRDLWGISPNAHIEIGVDGSITPANRIVEVVITSREDIDRPLTPQRLMEITAEVEELARTQHPDNMTVEGELDSPSDPAV